jgi:methionine-S-sulfoxide reductase
MEKELKKATFAGGCFWCMQPPFRNLVGVTDVVSGYAGGTKPNPRYEEVSSGTTGHLEAVQVTYDPDKISYDQLLDVFWRQIDPTDAEGQFADKGSQYRTAIFYHNDEQKRLAEASKRNLDRSGKFKIRLQLKYDRTLISTRPKNTTRIMIRRSPGSTIPTRPSPGVNPSSGRCGAQGKKR